MSRIYITNAIVCGSKANMTSDKSYLLFTQELGMLWATARSVRMEKSKQRCALQDFSIIRISLIQGKSVWRIGSVESLHNPFLSAQTRTSRAGVTYIIKALRRYVHGQETVHRTYTDAHRALSKLSSLQDMAIMAIYQQVFTLRMLHELGYIKTSDEIIKLLDEEDIEKAVLGYDSTLDCAVTKCIEHASQVSHL